MIDHVEKYTKIRYWLVAILGLAYLLSQLASLSFTSSLTGLSEQSLTMIDNIGFAILTATVIIGAWAFMSARKQGTGVMAALNDELTKAHMQKAGMFSFKFVFIFSFFLFIAAKHDLMTNVDTARAVFTACLVVFYLRFAWLEAKHA